MVSRFLEGPQRELMGRYPMVTLTGPRQAGKTTDCRLAFPDLPYANLEAATCAISPSATRAAS